jgi:radical SAM protein
MQANRTADIDFARAPFTVIWEVTRACKLRCVHCRASAQPARHPLELTTAEGRDLLDQIRDLGSPVFVITGGDPLERPDLFDLVAHGVERGLSVAVTPSGTSLLTPAAVQRLRDLGVRRLGLSLDGACAAEHDAFRQEPGSYAWTVDGIRAAVAGGMAVQINTTVTRRTVDSLPAIARVVRELGAAVWSAFFLVTVGRARQDDQLSAEECEGVFAYLYELADYVPFVVRTAAAPHYRRFVLQEQRYQKRHTGHAAPTPTLLGLPRPRQGVTDGNGILFVSHIGDVYPSGFLPIRVGNVRRQPLGDIYREAPLLRRLRDTDRLGGKCGRCDFRHVCGGSRARAYATSGDPFAEDPLCLYQPRPRQWTV